MPSPTRCQWAARNELFFAYHDTEWGVPLHDDCRHFEFLVLDGAQAGLSWATILKKRDRYREVYDGFDPALVARYDDAKVAALLADPGIVRNRLKVASSITNAQAFLRVQEECGSFDAYIWRFTEERTLHHGWSDMRQIPARSAASDAMSKDLLKRGFRFVGSTICYAYMQAAGMVSDHTTDCFRYPQLTAHA